MKIILAQVICTTLIFNMVVQLILMCLFIALPNLLTFLLSSSSCAGVGAAAGELAKHQRHQDVVEEAGCDIVPLVVETFGVWSLFAL